MRVPVRLLGRVEPDVGGRLPAALLSLLALARGAPVSTGDAAQVLWRGAPPPTATKSLQNLVVRLRRVLGPDAVVRVGDGYALEARTDVSMFEELVGSGQYATALTLWHGPPWQELAGHADAELDALRLAELHRRAQDGDLLDRLARRDDLPGLVVEADARCREEPLREDRWAVLVDALALTGRRAEALRAAQDARTALASVGLPAADAVGAAERRALVAGGGGASTPLALPLVEEGAATMAAEALASGDHAGAIRWFRHAGHEPALAEQLARALADRGDAAEATAVRLLAAANAESREDFDAAARLLAPAVTAASISPPAEDALGPALERLLDGPISGSTRAQVLAALALHHSLDTDNARRWLTEAGAADRAHEHTRDLALALVNVAGSPHGLAERLDAARTLEVFPDPNTHVTGLAVQRSCLLELGDVAHEHERQRLATLATQLSVEPAATWARYWSSGRPLLDGDLSGAEAECTQSGLIAGGQLHGSTSVVLLVASQLFAVRWMQQRLGELVDTYRLQHEHASHVPTVSSAYAMALACSGRTDDARAVAAPFFEHGLETIPRNVIWSATLWHLTQTAIELGSADWAEALLDELQPLDDLHAVFSTSHLGSFAHLRAQLHLVLGHRHEASSEAQRSLALHERLGARWWASRDRSLVERALA